MVPTARPVCAGTLAVALLLCPARSAAEAPSTPGDSTDVNDARTGIAFSLSASWTGDALRVLGGGLRHDAALMGLADLSVVLDVGHAPGHGVAVFAQALGMGGSPLSSRVGDVQGISNIEAPGSWRLYQLWMEHENRSGHLAILAGLFDLNSEFYVTEASGAFLNPSHGIGPEVALTGEGGPSIYPNTSLALRIRWDVASGMTWRTAVFDGVPGAPGDVAAPAVSLSRADGALVVSELEARGGAFDERGEGVRVAAGAWAYTTSVPALLPGGEAHHNRGAYAMVEGRLPGCSGGRCIKAFLRAGVAEPRVNAVAAAWGAGMVVEHGEEGPLLGLALARAGSGADYRALRLEEGARADDGELNLELTGRIPLGSRISLRPDVQYVVDPGMDGARDDALVAGVRVVLRY